MAKQAFASTRPAGQCRFSTTRHISWRSTDLPGHRRKSLVSEAEDKNGGLKGSPEPVSCWNHDEPFLAEQVAGLFLCFSFSRGPWLGHAVTSPEPLNVKGLGRGTVALDGDWQFHLGDDPAWASPGLDDSNWERIGVDKPWGLQTHFGYTGYAWYRRHVNFLPVPGVQPDLALLLPSINDAYEVYWNGSLIGHRESCRPTLTIIAVFRAQILPLGQARFRRACLQSLEGAIFLRRHRQRRKYESPALRGTGGRHRRLQGQSRLQMAPGPSLWFRDPDHLRVYCLPRVYLLAPRSLTRVLFGCPRGLVPCWSPLFSPAFAYLLPLLFRSGLAAAASLLSPISRSGICCCIYWSLTGTRSCAGGPASWHTFPSPAASPTAS